jgi:hypothetical protein
MPQAIRLWQISEEAPSELKTSILDLENRLEGWLEQDIGMLSPDLLVIGKQVATDHGGYIDLLALNSSGDVVIIELKRDRTPRQITAQVLDYASWIVGLDDSRIAEIAARYLGSHGPLEKAFVERFGVELPEALNQAHRMLVVGAAVDPASERIIRYLSNTYGVDINAATFQYFRDEAGHELLGRVFLMEPAEVAQNSDSRGSAKRKPNLTQEELRALAEENDAAEHYEAILRLLKPHFEGVRTTQSTLNLVGTYSGGRGTVFNLLPGDSSAETGVRFQIYATRLAEYAKVPIVVVTGALPPGSQPWSYTGVSDEHWSGFTGFLKSDDAQRLADQVFREGPSSSRDYVTGVAEPAP